MADKSTPQELRQRHQEAVKEALESFPYERIEVTGDQALATWESLRQSGRGAPVVIGSDDDFQRIVQGATDWPGQIARKTPEQILEAAALIRHPEDLTDMRAKEREKALQLFKEKPELPWITQQQPPPGLENFLGGTWQSPSREEIITSLQNADQPAIGEWPSDPIGAPELTVATGGALDFSAVTPGRNTAYFPRISEPPAVRY